MPSESKDDRAAPEILLPDFLVSGQTEVQNRDNQIVKGIFSGNYLQTTDSAKPKPDHILRKFHGRSELVHRSPRPHNSFCQTLF